MSISGTDFEKLIKPFFESTLTRAGYKVLEVRNQDAGTQNGFDIYLKFMDKNCIIRHFYVECKNYTSPLYWSRIFNKQYDLYSSMEKVDAFVLISPQVDLSNIDHKVQINAGDYFKFPTGFLTPNSGVKDILSLDPIFLKKVTDEDYVTPYSEDERINKFSDQIDALIQEKDFPNKKPRKKNTFSSPLSYITRRVMDYDQKVTENIFSKGETLYDLLKKEDRIALLGWAGSGKSTEIEVLLNKLSDPKELLYPFLLKLNVFDDRSIAESLPGLVDVPDFLIMLCLDGLDEVQSIHFDTVTRKIQQFGDQFPRAKIVVSCRSNFYTTHSENNALNTLRSFKSYYLSALNHDEIEDYLFRKLPLKRDVFLKEIELRQLSNLLETPYYLIKLADLFLSSDTLPPSKSDLFEEVISSNIERDVARYFNSNRDATAVQMRDLLQKLAFILEYQGKNNITTRQLLLFLSAEELILLKGASSNVYGEEGSESIWQFNHNNTQEYLTAKVLSTRNYKEIISTITFGPDLKKIKPSWANTLSFLIDILSNDSFVKRDILNLLEKNEPELLVKFEPDKLDEQVRLQIFKRIFNYYKKEKRWINRSKYRNIELVKFSHNRETLDFLEKELLNADSPNARLNALQLLSHFSRELSGKSLTLRNSMKKELSTKGENPAIALGAYIDLFNLTGTQLDEIMILYSGNINGSIRSLLFQAIHDNDLQDSYIVYVLEQASILIHDEISDSEHISNEYYELVNCIQKIKTESSLHKVLEFFGKEYDRIHGSIYFREIMSNAFNFASKKFPNNEEVYASIRSLFIHQADVYDGGIQPFIKYFEMSGGVINFFTSIIDNASINKTFGLVSKLAAIADRDCITKVADNFINGLLDYDTASSFLYNLNANRSLQLYYYELLKNTGLFPKPVAKDLVEERNRRDQQTRELIFSKNKFKQAIEAFFSDAGKDILTYVDIREIHHSRFPDPKYLSVIYDFTRIEDGQTLDKNKVLNYIEEKWQQISISQIMKFLKGTNLIMLTNDEYGIVRAWCDEAISKVKFTEALSYPDENRTVFNRDAIKLSYLIRKLSIKDYSVSIYLDMLSFIKYDDSEIEIFDFVESFIPSSTIEEQVQTNISNGIRYYPILQAHLNYCEKHKLKKVTPDLLKYCKNNRTEILDLYIKLGGSIAEIETMLSDSEGVLHFQIIGILISNNREVIKPYLLSKLKNEKDIELRVRYAEYLIMLGEIKGIDVYIDYIKVNNTLPGWRSIRFSPFRELKSLKALDKLFYMLELSYSVSYKPGNFNELLETAVSAIKEISLYEENFWRSKQFYSFYKMKFKLKSFLHIHKIPRDILITLDNLYESMEQQYYINKGTRITLEEAVQVYEKF